MFHNSLFKITQLFWSVQEMTVNSVHTVEWNDLLFRHWKVKTTVFEIGWLVISQYISKT